MTKITHCQYMIDIIAYIVLASKSRLSVNSINPRNPVLFDTSVVSMVNYFNQFVLVFQIRSYL